jgi:hypothetical protein
LFVHFEFYNAVHDLNVFIIVIESKQLVSASRNTGGWLKALLLIARVRGVETMQSSHKGVLFVELEEV